MNQGVPSEGTSRRKPGAGKYKVSFSLGPNPEDNEGRVIPGHMQAGHRAGAGTQALGIPPLVCFPRSPQGAGLGAPREC